MFANIIRCWQCSMSTVAPIIQASMRLGMGANWDWEREHAKMAIEFQLFALLLTATRIVTFSLAINAIAGVWHGCVAARTCRIVEAYGK